MTDLVSISSAKADEQRAPVSRDLDPFAYWPHYASAIPSFGGGEMPHEPLYCFCTDYVAPAPGRSSFVIDITGAQATKGEIALRVNGLKLGDPPHIALITNDYIRLDDIIGDTINYTISFVAQEEVQYALYAHFNAPSDLRAEHVAIRLEEHGDAVPIRANLSDDVPSCFARSNLEVVRRLIAIDIPAAVWAMSHARPRLPATSGGWQTRWPSVIAREPDFARQWEAITVLETLDLARVDAKGARGLLIDVASPPLEAVLTEHAIEIEALRLADGDASAHGFAEPREGAFDFVVSHTLNNLAATAEGRLSVIGEALRYLRGGGLGLFVFPFWTGTSLDPVPVEAAGCADRNEVQQIALRLVGLSYSISQIVFPTVQRGEGEITAFIMSVRKLV